MSREVYFTILALAAFLIFFRLGHYSLWADEALNALGAKGFLLHGDTSVILDHGNLLIQRTGLHLNGFYDRYQPPLGIIINALSFAIFGFNTWAARLPFALCGLASIAILLYWIRHQSKMFIAFFVFGLLCNVSLFLYFRQCRYYALSTFLIISIAYLYWHWNGKWQDLILLSILSICLCAANYMHYAAVYLCLATDYLLWRRKERPLNLKQWLVLILPQILINSLIISLWNPMRTDVTHLADGNSLLDRLTLFGWFWRDSAKCEYFSVPLMLIGLAFCWHRKDWLPRAFTALGIALFFISQTSPQAVHTARLADIRYAEIIIPLCLAIQAQVLWMIWQRYRWGAGLLAVFCFTSNLSNGGGWWFKPARSTIASYLMELADPPTDPYQPTALWINQYIPEGSTVWVLPDYATHPLMFHAPKVHYACQFEYKQSLAGPYASLPDFHFKGKEWPQYVILMGSQLPSFRQQVGQWKTKPPTYKVVKIIDTFGIDVYRPELFWRTFRPVVNYNKNMYSVFILKKLEEPTH